MKPLTPVILILALVHARASAQANADTVNGWYFLSVSGGTLGETYSEILPGENPGLCQMFHYRTVTPGVRTYITWEKRYDPGFATPQFLVIRVRIHGPEPSMSYATAKLYFGDDDSTYGISPPGHGEILMTAGDSAWQDVRYSTGQIMTPGFNRIRLEFSFELPPTQPASAEYEFDRLIGIYPGGDETIIEPFGNSGLTSAPGGGKTTPSSYALDQNYPNPFNPTTRIQFSIASPTSRARTREAGPQLTTLKVYDLLGREVATLVNEAKEPGTYIARWDASHVASGVYMYRLQVGGFVETKKLVLLR